MKLIVSRYDGIVRAAILSLRNEDEGTKRGPL
jgi:hypothetical protein